MSVTLRKETPGEAREPEKHNNIGDGRPSDWRFHGYSAAPLRERCALCVSPPRAHSTETTGDLL